jgi:hypothetical protein
MISIKCLKEIKWIKWGRPLKGLSNKNKPLQSKNLSAFSSACNYTYDSRISIKPIKTNPPASPERLAMAGVVTQ